MTTFDQYNMPYMPTYFQENTRARMIFYVLGGVALVLFVWWFIQVVIGRNFKIDKGTYTDNAANAAQNGGNTTTTANSGGGMWQQNGRLTDFLEKLIDDLHRVNSDVKSWWFNKCNNSEERNKLYWDFIGLSEGYAGQMTVAIRYKTKFGISIKQHLLDSGCPMPKEIYERLEPILNTLPD